MDKSRILITGGSGLLGSNAARIATEGFEVYATYNSHASQIAGCKFVHLDIRDRQEVNSVFESVKPALVIHAAGLANVDYCEEHEDEARAINADGTENVAMASKGIEAKLIYISTDSVFDGEKGMYTEEDTPHPLSIYAETKLEGEKRVQYWMPDSIIVRTAFYGWSLHDKLGLAEWVANSLREGKKLKMWNDAFFSPILVNNLVQVLIAMYHKNLGGIYHVGGKERCSKYAFGQELAQAFGLDRDYVELSSVTEAALRAPRPKDISLNITKISEVINTRLLNVKEGIACFKDSEPSG